jgi:hypothetical protein
VPFTLAHPAAVAPLWRLARRRRPWFAALVVGTMTPDFEYLLRLTATAVWGHSLLGLVRFCLPVGLVALAAWEGIIRAPARRVLALPTDETPVFGPADERWRWWARAAAGILLGAATHLLWDGLTHGAYWGAAILPGLRSTAVVVGGRAIPWFNLFQHASTAVGGLVVSWWLWRTLEHAGAPRVIARSPWRLTVMAGVAVTAAAAGVWNGWRWGMGPGYWNVQVFVGRVAVGTLAGLAAALVVGGLAFRWARPDVGA